MPTASAKVEKIASNEVCDPMKQVVVLVEKKVRNLEKRKGKLDNYRNDHKNGKELNEDQKNAIMKYDQVIEVLEFAKELQKSFNVIFQETARYQKKAQKKEFAERQHHEFQQIRQLLLFQNILAKLLIGEVRNDFLNGENGAVKLSEEEINNLEKFYKLVSFDENGINCQSYENYFSSAAEHFVALLEAKNRSILGMTYKHLKETLMKIQDCGYFTNQSVQNTDDDSTEEHQALSEEEIKGEKEGEKEELNSEVVQNTENVNGSSEVSESLSVNETEEICAKPVERTNNSTNQLQDVLPIQGNFNFLQESQIDMESPHMDPAVVVAHPMAPPPNSSYRHSQFNSVAATTTSQVISENEAPCIPTTIVVPLQTIPVPSPGNPALTLSQAALNHPPQDYDPNQPIPTQTFTNQNFVAMQNIMTVVSPYVPVTVPAQHFTPDNILQQQSTNIITSVETPAVEHADTGDNNEISEKNNGTDDKETEEATGNGENRVADQEQESANQSESQTNYTSHAQNNHQSRSFSNRGSRGGRGRSFNYLRGRSYGNGRGYYQGSYGGRDSSGSSSGYNGYRRPPRGGIRGGMRGGNNRGGGRGGYRPQQ